MTSNFYEDQIDKMSENLKKNLKPLRRLSIVSAAISGAAGGGALGMGIIFKNTPAAVGLGVISIIFGLQELMITRGMDSMTSDTENGIWRIVLCQNLNEIRCAQLGCDPEESAHWQREKEIVDRINLEF